MVNFSGGVIDFPGAPLGLNTVDPSFLLEKGEATELLNWEVLKGGALKTRPPAVKHNSTAVASVKAIEKVIIAGTARELIATAAKIYYINAGVPTEIGDISGAPTIFGFDGKAAICDGSYLKYLDGVTEVKIAYDNGTGTTGFQFNNRTGTKDTSLALGNGTNTRIAYKFTSQAWDAGYTIPPTTMYASIYKTGSPTGSITMKLRAVADDSVLATGTFLSDVSTLDGTSTEYSATFAAADISTEMSQATAYYLSLEYSAGDASNYVNVSCTTVASAGAGYHYAGSWTQDATANPVMGMRPGRPPKATFGMAFNGRPFVSGDPGNPAYLWYGNRVLTDWSTASGGGYLSPVDDSGTNYEIGAIEELYGNLYQFGKQAQPYITVLSGTTPSDFALVSTAQNVWATHGTIKSTGNDVWFASSDGVSVLSGVQEYGDLRYSSASRPVDNRITSNWATSTAIAGYYPKGGQYWLYMPTYNRILVANTKAPVDMPSGRRYPWSEYELYRNIFTTDTYKWTLSGSGTNEYYVEIAAGGDPSIATQPDFIVMDGVKLTEGTAGSLADHEWDYGDNDALGYSTVYLRDESGDPDSSGVVVKSVIAPQCFAAYDGTFFIGGSDGFVYKIDTSEYKDLTTLPITFDWQGRFVQSDSDYITLTDQQVLVASRFGAQFTFSVYRNDVQRTVAKTYLLSIDDRLNIGDLTGDLGDGYFIVDPEGQKTFHQMRMTGFSFKPRIHNLYLSGEPLLFRGCFFKYIKAGA